MTSRRNKRDMNKRDRSELSLMDGMDRALSRTDLLTILSLTACDTRLDMLRNMLTDPTWATKKLATMARECNVTFKELAAIVKEHKTAEGQVRLAMKIPQVMEDVANDALNTTEHCPKCQGVGSIFDPIKKSDDGAQLPMECPQCKGEGEIKKSGDQSARKLVFEAAGLIGGRGPLVAIQNNKYGGGGDDDDVESILKLTRKQPAQLTAEIVKEGE